MKITHSLAEISALARHVANRNGTHVQIRRAKSGVPTAVIVNGFEIPQIEQFTIHGQPSEPTLLEFRIYVDSIETVEE